MSEAIIILSASLFINTYCELKVCLEPVKTLMSENQFVFDSSFFIEDQVYNRHLKEIGKLAEIGKKLSNKVARHTNAQLWIRYGADRPAVSKMMGHTKEETTKSYYDINIPEIVA